MAIVRQLGDIFADAVGEFEPPLLYEERRTCCRKLFGHGGNVKRRARRDRYAVLQVRHSVAFGKDEPSIANHSYRESRCFGTVPARKQGVYLRRKRYVVFAGRR